MVGLADGLTKPESLPDPDVVSDGNTCCFGWRHDTFRAFSVMKWCDDPGSLI